MANGTAHGTDGDGAGGMADSIADGAAPGRGNKQGRTGFGGHWPPRIFANLLAASP